METKVIDWRGAELKVGSRVSPDLEGEASATVIAISDPDGDVDDYGRSIGIPPFVTVEYGSGDTEQFSTSWTAAGWWDEDAPYECDDLRVVPE